jgi:hypothetical protein
LRPVQLSFDPVHISDLTMRNGGIYMHAGQLTLSRVRIIGSPCNAVEGMSSGLHILDSILEENTQAGIGAVYSDIKVARSTIRRNGGAGIACARAGVVIESSTISQNKEGVSCNRITITNSTVSGNQEAGVVTAPPKFDSNGTIQYSTIVGNRVGLLGGRLLNVETGERHMGTWIEIGNSVVAGNLDGDCDAYPEGGIRSLGHNLMGNTTGCNFIPADGDLVGSEDNPIDPKLGPLQDNGGPTFTHALLEGSPAIDAGANATCAAELVNSLDQRGALRPVDGDGDGSAVCDSGAYELQQEQLVAIDIKPGT